MQINGKLCFPLREIDFVTENSLPARGWKTPPKSSFFTGHSVCRGRIPDSRRILAGFARNPFEIRSNLIRQHSKTDLYRYKKGRFLVRESALFELQLSEFSIFRNGQMAFRIYLKSYGENRFDRS